VTMGLGVTPDKAPSLDIDPAHIGRLAAWTITSGAAVLFVYSYSAAL